MLFPGTAAAVAPPDEIPVVVVAAPAGAVEDDAEASEAGAFPGTHIFR